MKQLEQLQPSLVKNGSIRSIKIINAISCDLPVGSKIAHIHSKHIQLEADTKVYVHETVKQKNLVERPLTWGIKLIKAPSIWNKSMGSHVKVAVIDTGVDHSHPDLRHCLSRGVNFIQRNMLPHDDNGHGTHIAGTIAAAGKLHGLVGVAPRASIHAVKAFDRNGSAFISDIILGIDWCVRNHIDIINMSFGMKTTNPALLDAVRKAHQAGVVIVASSGNDGKRLSIDFPARYPQTISVGAIGMNRKIAPFSNRSKNIDIFAPGEKIVSTWLRGKYNELSGTSMATSHVSGVIALLLGARPGMRPDDIKALLKQGALPLLGPKVKGTGRIDAVRVFRGLK